MKFVDQEKWINQAIQQKERALAKLTRIDDFNAVLEGDLKALKAILQTISRHRAMKEAVETVKAMPQTAALLKESTS